MRDRTMDKDFSPLAAWILAVAVAVAVCGCTTNLDVRPYPDEPDWPYIGQTVNTPYKADTDSVIALAWSTNSIYVPDETDGGGDDPKPGDKCPDCNDPPGACGVGKVGDGRICQTCDLCKGDGRIDESDLQEAPRFPGVTQIDFPSEPDFVPEPTPDPVPDAPPPAETAAQNLGVALDLIELRRRVDALEASCANCECKCNGKCLTEEDVRQIVREEFQVLIRKADGGLRTSSVKASETPDTPIINSTKRVATKVPGLSGTFELGPGEKVVAIGGVPVGASTPVPIRLEGGDVIPSWTSSAGPVRMQATRSVVQPTRIRIQAFRPFSSFGSSASCATGNCSGGR